MHRTIAVAALVFFAGATFASPQNPSEPAKGSRKVILRTTAQYPDIARRMHLLGSVKLEVTVRPNGSVKSCRVIGGSPVLVEAATEAVMKWKYEPEANETKEAVDLSFMSDKAP